MRSEQHLYCICYLPAEPDDLTCSIIHAAADKPSRTNAPTGPASQGLVGVGTDLLESPRGQIM